MIWDRDPRLHVDAAEMPDHLFAGARVLHVDGVDEEASIAAASRGRSLGLIVTSDIDTVAARTAELVDRGHHPDLCRARAGAAHR